MCRSKTPIRCDPGVSNCLISGCCRSGQRRRGLTLIELVVVLIVLVALGAIIAPLLNANFEIDPDGDGEGKTSQQVVTEATMVEVAEAIVGPGGYAEAMRFALDANGVQFGSATGLPWPGPAEVSGGRENHPQLRYLFQAPVDAGGSTNVLLGYDPVTRIGWRDAWLSAATATLYEIDGNFSDDYGEDGDLAPIDGWGNPIVIQLPNGDPNEINNVRLVSAGPNRVLDTPGAVSEPDGDDKLDDLVLYLYREAPSP
ncbi:MAG: prepilin-type N-terminal cleavage/methylation domain-containing protein [Planctomycetota bacterium]